MDDFSLIILCRGRRHLLPLTLDTLKPQSGAFEVLLLDGEGSGRLAEQVSRYPELSMRVQSVSGKNLAEMMNEGVRLARGRYVQFLEPGDRYISQHGLEFIGTLIQKEPHLIYASPLEQGGISPADLIMSRSPWFLKSKVLEMGGFDKKLSSCPSLDLLCRMQNQEAKSVFCKRVLVDSEKEPAVPLRETCKVLYRHFGLWRALKWIFVQDHSLTLRRTLSSLKEAFWKGD
jgi:glycosyltransferase involved in cell wall biosynthesis